MFDHDPYRIHSFQGVYDRGEDEVCPKDHFIQAQNLSFTRYGVQTREGTLQSLGIASVRRMDILRRPGEAQRLLILNTSGELFDSTNLGTPILTIAAMTDFSVVVISGRAYITPHNGLTGLPGEKVYVYLGSGQARAAAGTSPSGSTIVAANSSVSGTVEAGTHGFGVAYETNTGYITGPGGFVSLVSSGGKKVDVSAIPLGPSHVVARHIIATKLLLDFKNDFQNQDWFFVPGGRVANNTDTTVTVDFFDADLQADANYLFDQLDEIPAGVGIGDYRGHMVCWGSDANSSTCYVSKVGEPESTDGAEGFFNANPGDAGSGIRNCTEYRGSLIIQKDRRTYITTDNSENAAFWEVTLLDASVGAECHTVAKIGDFGSVVQDILLIADRSGLRLFNGTFLDDPLSYKIDDLWSRINGGQFHKVSVVVDPVAAKIYCAVPLDGAVDPSHVFVCDYNEGMDPDKVKWCPWVFPKAPTSIVVDTAVATKINYFRFGSIEGGVFDLSPVEFNDSGIGIDHFMEFPFLPLHEDEKEEGFYHYAGIRLRAKGIGNVQISLRNQDNTLTTNPVGISLIPAPGRSTVRKFNFKAEKCAVKLRLSDFNERIYVNSFTLLYQWWASEVTA